MSPVWEACLFSGSCICWRDWWEPPQSSKQPWATSLPFPARVSAASCPHSVTASPSPHLVIKPRLYTLGVQVSICLHNHCQQLSIINCQGCFKAMQRSFSWHGDQVFLYLKKKKNKNNNNNNKKTLCLNWPGNFKFKFYLIVSHITIILKIRSDHPQSYPTPCRYSRLIYEKTCHYR